MTARSGFSTLELMIALVLGTLVAGAAFTLLQGQSRLAHSTSDSAEAAETLRTATQVLTAETRWLVPARDVRAISPESLSLRAFRGSGVVCAFDSAYGAVVDYRGLRDPDPSKDSVLIERGASQELVGVVLGVVPGAVCGNASALKLAVNQPVVAGDVLIVFESGNYYLSTRALRYRLGSEGRQPITAELLDDSRTSFVAVPGSWNALLGFRAQRGRSASRGRVRLPFAEPPL